MKTEESSVKETYEVPEVEVIEMEMENAIAAFSNPKEELEDEDWG